MKNAALQFGSQTEELRKMRIHINLRHFTPAPFARSYPGQFPPGFAMNCPDADYTEDREFRLRRPAYATGRKTLLEKTSLGARFKKCVPNVGRMFPFYPRKTDDKPVTTRKDAEKAAALLRPVLRARQKEEIALHIASARRMRKESCLTIDHVWQTYLAQSQRPDSSPGTLHSYQKSWNGLLAWLSRKHPELRNVSQLHEEIAAEYFNDIRNGNLSARTYNAYRQALKLIFKHIMPVAGLESNPFNKTVRKTGHSESRNEFTSDQVQAIFDGFQKGFYYTFGTGRAWSGTQTSPETGYTGISPLA